MTGELTAGTQRLQEGQSRLAEVRREVQRLRREADAAHKAVQVARARLEGLVDAAYRLPQPNAYALALTGGPGSLLDAALSAADLEHVQGNHQDTLREAQAQSTTAESLTRRAEELERDAEAQAADLATQVAQLQRSADEAGARIETAARELEQARNGRTPPSRVAPGGQPAPGAPPLVLPPTGADARGCGGRSTEGYPNGFLPASALCPLAVGSGHRLRADAAAAFNAMYAAGAPCITDSYRSYAAQVDVFRRKPDLAAVPGTSNHGWGIAIDFGCGAERFDSDAYRWLKANAGRFGFAHPTWAEPDGSKPEPWHWEYVGRAR